MTESAIIFININNAGKIANYDKTKKIGASEITKVRLIIFR